MVETVRRAVRLRRFRLLQRAAVAAEEDTTAAPAVRAARLDRREVVLERRAIQAPAEPVQTRLRKVAARVLTRLMVAFL